jgi:hypothetical protein
MSLKDCEINPNIAIHLEKLYINFEILKYLHEFKNLLVLRRAGMTWFTLGKKRCTIPTQYAAAPLGMLISPSRVLPQNLFCSFSFSNQVLLHC